MDIYTLALLLSCLLAISFSSKSHITGIRGTQTVHRVENFAKAFLVLLPLTLVIAFRWDVGADSLYGESYQSSYVEAATGINSRGFEQGYFLFSAFFSSFQLPYFWYLFIISMIYMVCATYGIQKVSVSPVLSIATFVLLMPYFDSFSSLRQSLAQCICLVAVARWLTADDSGNPRIQDGAFLVTVLLGAMFHSTALLYIPLFFISRTNYGQKNLTIITLFTLAFTPVVNMALQWIFDNLELNTYESGNFASSFTLISLVFFGLCLWKYYDILQLNPRAYFIINHAFCTFVLMLNSNALLLPFRIFELLKICYIFTVPYIVKSFKIKRKRLIMGLVLVMMMIVFYINSMYTQNNLLAKYQSVFENWFYYTSLY